MNHIMHDQPPLTGWVYVNPASLDDVAVTDDTGNTIASRPVPREVRSEEGWDRALYNLGYTRTGDWTRTAAGNYRCAVDHA